MVQVNINLCMQCRIFRTFCPANQLAGSTKKYESFCRHISLLHTLAQKFSVTSSLVMEEQQYMRVARMQKTRIRSICILVAKYQRGKSSGCLALNIRVMQKEVLRRINSLLFFLCNFSIWYNKKQEHFCM